MYRRITIKNFRSIEDATVVVSPFTVVVGPNGSGKSNFADAFVFMRDAAFDAETAVSGRGGITSVTRWAKTRPYDVTVELRVAPTPEALESRFFAHALTISSASEGAWKFKRETVRFGLGDQERTIERKGRTVTGIKAVRDLEIADMASVMTIARTFPYVHPALKRALFGVWRYRLAPDEMRRPQLVSESPRLSEDGTNIATAIRKLREEDALDAVLEPMRRIVPGLRDIRHVAAGRHVLLEFEQQQSAGVATFTASEVSEGALRALGVIVAARQMQKDELLIIEEPEANIHAGAAGLIFDVLKEASRQGSVLITTHSPELLDAAHDEDIVVCSYSDGVTRLGPLDSAQRQLVRDGLFKLAELMRAGPLRIEGDLPETAGA